MSNNVMANNNTPRVREQGINNPVKQWLIISWRRKDLMDGSYGNLLTSWWGSYEEAAQQARQYTHDCGPIGIMEAIE